MDVDDLLDSADLPDVPVEIDHALASTMRRGRARRQRRTAVLGASAALLVGAFAAVGLSLSARDDHRQVSAGSTTSTLPRSPEPGHPAVWLTDPEAPPSSDATTFTALVMRLGCGGGATGQVLRPGVVIGDTEVVVTFTVAIYPDDILCPNNDQVPYEVDLGQPLGERRLVDGSCRPGGDAEATPFCTNTGSVRWQFDPPGRPMPVFPPSEVKGQLLMVGGPPDAEPTPVPGTVTAENQHGGEVVTAETDGDGRFVLQLPRGSYRLTGRSPSYQDGNGVCSAERPFVVEGEVTDIEVLCERR